ncbi:Transcriptional repressor NrdR [uncultured archaeon]|nr:Transcriptional repressor NrdR [uncultured archaeon]
MRCPYCSNEETKVVDKRDTEGLARRRRECLKCEKRFTTYERVQLDLTVIKKDGKKEKFDAEKLKRGVCRALEKRPIEKEDIEQAIIEIESRIYRVAKDEEIQTSKIGEIIMDKLKKMDKVAYIRFASVYREFADLEDFKREMKELK